MLRILIIDDEESILDILDQFLSVSGHHCEVYTDPLEAVEEFKKNSFDLVISDIRMPKMNGFEVAEEVAKSRENVSVILISGFPEQFENNVAAGNYICMGKPLNLMKLKNIVDEIEAESTPV